MEVTTASVGRAAKYLAADSTEPLWGRALGGPPGLATRSKGGGEAKGVGSGRAGCETPRGISSQNWQGRLGDGAPSSGLSRRAVVLVGPA